jgi:kynurenine formamidase
MLTEIPRYADLSIGAGGRHASGIFGADDDLGRLNLLTADATNAAAAEIQRGRIFNLSLPLNLPDPPWSKIRKPYSHHIYHFDGREEIQDDYVDGFYLQHSTQWDGLRHVSNPATGRFYNDVEASAAGPGGTRLGIEKWAQHGIAGRAVLADVSRYASRSGRPLNPRVSAPITVQLLADTLRAEGVDLRAGDILLVRTGFLEAYLAADAAGRRDFARHRDCPGLHSGEEMAEFLWDSGVAVVAADNLAVEPVPPFPADESLHQRLIPLLGFALGELFELGDLARDSAADGRYTSFFVAVPLYIPGGVGSPGNAIAIK